MSEKENLGEFLGLTQGNEVDREFDHLEEVVEGVVDFDFSKYMDDKAPSAIDDDNPILDNLHQAEKVDITKLQINNKTALDKETDIKSALFGRTSVVQVVAAQSGYSAKVAPLVNKDSIQLLFDQYMSRYEQRKTTYNIIFNKCVQLSCGPMTFEEWLKNTSAEDIETLYYGVYCATFPNGGTFTFQCPNCDYEETFRVNNKNLFKTTDNDAMKKLVSDVSRNVRDKASMEKYSIINKTEAYKLSDTSIIAELRTPTLWDSLEILRTVPENIIDRDTNSVVNMLYTKRLLVPSENDSYSEVTDRQEILRIIDNLPIDDAGELKSAINMRVNEHRISYSLKNVKCQNCDYQAKEVPISIEEILFTNIFEKSNR